MAASINVQDYFINVKGLAISGRYWSIHLTARNCLLHFVTAGSILYNKKLASRILLDNMKYESNDGI